MNTRSRARFATRESRHRSDPDYSREERIQDASYTNMKVSKRDSGYRPDTDGEPCMSCESFIRPNGCSKVEGAIHPKATCDFYEWDGDSGLRAQGRALRD